MYHHRFTEAVVSFTRGGAVASVRGVSDEALNDLSEGDEVCLVVKARGLAIEGRVQRVYVNYHGPRTRDQEPCAGKVIVLVDEVELS